MRALLCLWHSGGECLLLGPGTCQIVCLPLQRSRHEAPTDGASLRLLHGVRRRRRREEHACSSVPLALD